jgi:hypothetical protein
LKIGSINPEPEVCMKKNVGLLDKVVRIIFVVLIAVLYFIHLISGGAAIILGAVAVILLLTSVMGFCPLYALLGISTAHKTGGSEGK